MNIFALHHSPVTSALMSAEKHNIKMQLESMQLLSTNWRLARGVEHDVTMPDGSVQTINLLDGETYVIMSVYDYHLTKNDTDRVKRVSIPHDSCVYDDMETHEQRGYCVSASFVKYKLTYDPATQLALSITHQNHPSCVWARSGARQYDWLVEHTYALEAEWRRRYGHDDDKRHKSVRLLDHFPSGSDLYPDTTFTLPTPAMPDEYIVDGDVVQSYRNYYLGTKMHMGIVDEFYVQIALGV